LNSGSAFTVTGAPLPRPLHTRACERGLHHGISGRAARTGFFKTPSAPTALRLCSSSGSNAPTSRMTGCAKAPNHPFTYLQTHTRSNRHKNIRENQVPVLYIGNFANGGLAVAHGRRLRSLIFPGQSNHLLECCRYRPQQESSPPVLPNLSAVLQANSPGDTVPFLYWSIWEGCVKRRRSIGVSEVDTRRGPLK